MQQHVWQTFACFIVFCFISNSVLVIFSNLMYQLSPWQLFDGGGEKFLRNINCIVVTFPLHSSVLHELFNINSGFM